MRFHGNLAEAELAKFLQLYVLKKSAAALVEGSLVTQVRGGNRMTPGPGDTFYESPHDVHRFLVFFVKQTGVPATVPAK
jgi:hypothetical protein